MACQMACSLEDPHKTINAFSPVDGQDVLCVTSKTLLGECYKFSLLQLILL